VPDAAAAMEVLLVDKPTGCTSHDVVALARRSLGVRKAGHAGTLDPIATGLLVLGLGRATRLLGYLTGLDKEYEAVARLGVATDTLDREGEVVAEDSAWVGLADAEVRRATSGILGTHEQTPPSYSAVKVGGVAAHRLTRRGEKVELPPRRVVVRELEVVGFELPEVRFRVLCSSGTYVRSLAAELGRRLGTNAHIAELRRTRVGSFSVADAASLAELRSGSVPRRARMGPVAALSHLPSIAVDERDAARLADGARVPASAADSAQATFVADEGDRLVAVGEVRGGVLRPRTVFRRGVGGR